MEILHLSTTLTSGWQLCPARAWDTYAIRNEVGDDSMSTNPTRFGSVVHDACEIAHNKQMRGEEIPDPVQLFDECWRERDCYDFDYYQLGRGVLGSFLERTIWERQGTTIATELHFLLDLVKQNVVLLDGFNREEIQALVQEIKDQGGVPVMSKIDRVDRDGDDLYIFDYKTNAVPFTRDEVDNSLQLGLYAMAAKVIYPWVDNLVCTFDMVRFSRYSTVFSDQKLEDMRSFLINLYLQIQEAESAEPRLNPYCNWCHLRGNCPVYQRALEDTIPEILTEEYDNPEGLEFLFEQWEELKFREKAIKNRLEEIGTMLSAKIVQGNGNPIQIGDREIFLQPNPRGEYPADKVFELFKQKKALVMLRDIMTIPKGAMDRSLKSIPFAKDVEALLVRGFNKSSLKARSLKPVAVEED